MLHRIPAELRSLRCWVVAGADKVPRCPWDGKLASVTDPSTWGTFQEALAAGYKHIGFVLTKEAGFCIIDLDDPMVKKILGIVVPNDDPVDVARIKRNQEVIASKFLTYQETSQSGKGIHIICKGVIPKGIHRDRIEMYSEGRYMICTGNFLNEFPIADCQGLVDQLYEDLGGNKTSTIELVEEASVCTDEIILRMATHASNGDKFNKLWSGDTTGYASHSEADFALIAMLCFYSRSNEQVTRLFQQSGLNREKATDGYFKFAFEKIRARQLPLVDLTWLINSPVVTPPAPVPIPGPAPVPPPPVQIYTIPPPAPLPPRTSQKLPPGLVGEIADYIYSSAMRPVHEVALAGSIAMMSGIAARQFNISNTGMNTYNLIVGLTGVGKEGAADGIDRLIKAVSPMVQRAAEFIGPSSFASGQAMVRMLDKKKCSVALMGEIGLTMSQWCSRHASPHQVQVRKVLLDVFSKSGWGRSLQASVYSDSEKNTQIVQAPCISFLGDTTPDIFFNTLDYSLISEGLLPRLNTFVYEEGIRVPSNLQEGHHPSSHLTEELVGLFDNVLSALYANSCCSVTRDPNAMELSLAYDKAIDERINSGTDEVVRQLWNRAHLKVLKIAGLVAIGCNPALPVVTKEIMQWAIDLVTKDIELMTAKFVGGFVGQGDHQLEREIREAINKFPSLTCKQRRSYNVPAGLCDESEPYYDKNIIPYGYLRKVLLTKEPFKNDKRGASMSLEIALRDMVKAGTLGLFPAQEAAQFKVFNSAVYYRGDSYWGV